MKKRLKLHSYQREAFNLIMKKNHVAIFADPGLGKTIISLYTIRKLKQIGAIKKALIIAPSIVCANTWPDEINDWPEFKKLRYHHLNPTTAKSVPFTHPPNKAVVHLINPESVKKLCESGKIRDYQLLIVDESTKFKNPTSVRFKTFKKHLEHFDYRIILTGTPTPKGIIDLWGQIYIIDLGKRLGKNITAYRYRYFNAIRNGGAGKIWFTYEPKHKAKKSVLKKIAPITMVIREKDHLDISEPIINPIKLRLPESKQVTYDKMEKALFAELDGTEIFAMSKGSSYNKCHQLANGAIWKNEDKKEFIRFHDLKLDAIENLVDELNGKPLLIGYRFKHDLIRLKERFGKRLKVLNKNKPARQKRWNRGKIEILAGQLQSVAFGLNLQKGGNDISFFSLTTNYEDYYQFIKRIHRQGVRGAVRVHPIIMRKTVDVAIFDRLKSRSKDENAVLEALHSYMYQKKNNLL